MTGVGEATIYRLLKQLKDGSVTVPPKKPTGRKPIQLDDSGKQMIQKKVHSFYFQKIIPTLDKVLVEINEDQSLPNIKRDKSWKVLHELDFVYAKQDRKSTLIEKEDMHGKCYKTCHGRGRKILDTRQFNRGNTRSNYHFFGR
nr:unnamed protein product [Callosobruchus analis]